MSARTRVRTGGGVVRCARASVHAAGANGLPSEHIAEVQRARLLAGAVGAVDELGYARATVTDITRRARVSRRTFYELFVNREECLAAVLESAVTRVRVQLARSDLAGLTWRERVREGLWTILCFLDQEPALACFCVVQSARGGQRVLERREQLLGELAEMVDRGRAEGQRGENCPPLTAEALVGGALAIVYARLLAGEHEPLTGLHGELTGMIVQPYLGASVARRERVRPVPSTPVSGASASVPVVTRLDGDALRDMPMRLTYRTMRVLEAVAKQPGLSNRQVGEHAGIPDQGQISKLMARLQRVGLLANAGEGHSKGEANRWTLTDRGQQITQTISAHAHDDTEVA